MAKSSSFTVALERVPGSSVVRAEMRCAHCSGAVVPTDAVYVLRFTIGDDGDLVRGSLSAGPGGPAWSFASGAELARLVLALPHVHEPAVALPVP